MSIYLSYLACDVFSIAVESVQRTLYYSSLLGPSPHDYPRIQLLNITLDSPILPTLFPLLYSNTYTPF
jgi:hypothetical protein